MFNPWVNKEEGKSTAVEIAVIQKRVHSLNALSSHASGESNCCNAKRRSKSHNLENYASFQCDSPSTYSSASVTPTLTKKVNHKFQSHEPQARIDSGTSITGVPVIEINGEIQIENESINILKCRVNELTMSNAALKMEKMNLQLTKTKNEEAQSRTILSLQNQLAEVSFLHQSSLKELQIFRNEKSSFYVLELQIIELQKKNDESISEYEKIISQNKEILKCRDHFIEQLQKQLDESHEIGNLAQELTEKEVEINGLKNTEREKANYRQTVSEYESKIDDLQEELHQLKEEVAEIDLQINELTDNLEKADVEKLNYQQLLSDREEKIDELQQQIEDNYNSDEIEKLEEELAEKDVEMDALNDKFEHIMGERMNYQKIASLHEQKINDLEQELLKNTNNAEETEKTLAEREIQIDALSKSWTEVKNELLKCQDINKQHLLTIDDLEQQLSEDDNSELLEKLEEELADKDLEISKLKDNLDDTEKEMVKRPRNY